MIKDGVPPSRVARPDALGFPDVVVLLLLGLATSAVWNYLIETPVAVFSALIQAGIPTRLVFLCLILGLAFALFVFRSSNRTRYGQVECIVGIATAWNMLGRLAIQITAADALGLAAAGYLLARGFVNIQEAQDRLEASV